MPLRWRWFSLVRWYGSWLELAGGRRVRRLLHRVWSFCVQRCNCNIIPYTIRPYTSSIHLNPPTMKPTLILSLALLPAVKGSDDGSNICTANGSESCVADDVHQATEELNVQPKQKIFECKDLDTNCPKWSKMSFNIGGVRMDACDSNSAYMAYNCPESCLTCEQMYLGHRLSKMLDGSLSDSPFCQDNNFQCRQFADDGECEKNPGYMRNFCEASCGFCSEVG